MWAYLSKHKYETKACNTLVQTFYFIVPITVKNQNIFAAKRCFLIYLLQVTLKFPIISFQLSWSEMGNTKIRESKTINHKMAV